MSSPTLPSNGQRISPIPRNFRVIGLANQESEYGSILVFKAKTQLGIRHYQIPVAELFTGDMKSLTTVLADSGNFDLLERKSVKSVAIAMLEKAQKQPVSILLGSGFQTVVIQGVEYRIYIWGGEAYWFGKQPKHDLVVIADKKKLQVSGSLEDWQKNIGALLPGNHYLIAIVVHALAAALRRTFNQPALTLGLVGASSTGKTSSQRFAQSMLGPSSEVRTMSGTAFGIRELLRQKADTPVFFQDTRQFTLAELIPLIFDVADGASRLKNGTDYVGLSSTLILSNERQLIHMNGSRALPMDEGICARFHEVICDAPFGAFHNIHEAKSPAEFAKQIETNCNRYFGVVWPAWLGALSANWDLVCKRYEKWLPKVKNLLTKKVGDGVKSRVNNRIFDSLAFSAWAGVVASSFKIIPLSPDEIIQAFAFVLQQTLGDQGEGSNPYARHLIAHTKGFLDEHHSEFPSLNSWATHNNNSALIGFQLTSKKDGELFLFFPHAFQKLFVDKYGDVVFKQLSDAGYLVTSKKRGHQFQVRLPGDSDKRMSFIAVKAAIRFC